MAQGQQVRPLSYLAFERYPLRRSDLSLFLGFLENEVSAPAKLKIVLKKFLAKYPEDFFQGSLKLSWPEDKVELTLILGDAAEALPRWVKFSPQSCTQWAVEAWYLDGFAPRKHLDLWTKDVFSMMALLSKRALATSQKLGCTPTLTTFTSAGWVRRGLEEAGFQVERIKGHGRKKQMAKAQILQPALNSATHAPQVTQVASEAQSADQTPLSIEAPFSAELAQLKQPRARGSTPPWDFLPISPPRLKAKVRPRAAVVGAGFAGTAMARELAQAGFEIHLFDEHPTLAGAASGQRRALTSPLITAIRDPLGDFTLMATMAFMDEMRELGITNNSSLYNPDRSGALICAYEPDELARLQSAVAQDLLRGSRAQWLSKTEASRKAQVNLSCDALFLPWMPWISGREICEARVNSIPGEQINLHLGEKFDESLSSYFDIVVLCTGASHVSFSAVKKSTNPNGCLDLSWMPLRKVRGQVSFLAENEISKNLNTALIFDGYFTPTHNGSHVLGSTFQNADTETELRDSDHEQILQSLRNIAPELAQNLHYATDGPRGQVEFRLMSPDVRPVVGALPDVDFFRQNYSDLDQGRAPTLYPAAKYLSGKYVLTALGSRGALYSSLFSKAIVDLITGKPGFLTQAQWNSIVPSRFLTRPILRRKPREESPESESVDATAPL